MLMKFLTVLASMAASAAFAATITTVETNAGGDAKALRNWDNVCVSNLEIEAGVAGFYKWGTDEATEWTAINFENNHMYIFSLNYPRGMEPPALQVKFM